MSFTGRFITITQNPVRTLFSSDDCGYSSAPSCSATYPWLIFVFLSGAVSQLTVCTVRLVVGTGTLNFSAAVYAVHVYIDEVVTRRPPVGFDSQECPLQT